MTWNEEAYDRQRVIDKRQARLMALSVLNKIERIKRKRAVVVKVIRRTAVRP